MTCKNCQNKLNDSNDYCNACGAKIIRNRLTLRNLTADIGEQYLDYDNKFLQTFIHLFKKPEDVIGGYINGTRKQYVNVISYFAIAITLSGLQIYIMKKYGMDLSMITNDNAVLAEQQQQLNSKVFEIVSEYQSLLMMLYIPLYALMAKLTFLKNKLYNYTEIIVIFMYAQAQVSIVAAILTVILVPLGVSMSILGLITLPLQFFFFAFCLKRMYRLDVAQIILKALIFLIILGVLGAILSVVAAYFMYQSGMFEEMIEAQKAAIEAQKAVKDSIN